MDSYICTTCGTQHAPTAQPPARCAICEDERQYVPESGQSWTTMAALRRTHRNSWRRHEPGLFGVGSEPSFAIGQRALLVRHPAGNVLWDCITLIDAATIDLVNGLGGLRAIAISHPHYYSGMVEWSHAFGGIPVHLHEDDREWIMRPDPVIKLWSGSTLTLQDGLTLIRCGGHFRGGTVLHWAAGADNRGAVLTGDIIQLSPDRRSVSFMYSYPNYIPLGAPAVERIVAAVEGFSFDRFYGAWWDRHIDSDAKGVLSRSANRYLAAIQVNTSPRE
jgi:hypothetical protein